MALPVPVVAVFSIKIISTQTWGTIAEIAKPKTVALDFSSKGTYLLAWEHYSVTATNSQGQPNLSVYETKTGDLVHTVTHKKQTNWQWQWSQDETLCARLINNDVVFYSVPNFDKATARISGQKIDTYSLAPEGSPMNLIIYVQGKSGQPSLAKLYQHPKFDTTLASKSFFQADNVEFYWKRKGTGVLLLACTDVDKTNSSYYGKQSLHFMSPKGETLVVVLSKEGPIFSVAWSPLGSEFCVVYGTVPAKATLFNLKCEPIFEFGTGQRNSIYFNPFGNIMLMGGFGALRGHSELWDMNARKLIAKIEAPDTTSLAWSPDGEHFMTATTAPRLKMGNGFKIWHYSGTLLYERPWNAQEELWEVLWQRFPAGTFKPPVINYKPVEGIQPSQPTYSKQVYRPPMARGRDPPSALSITQQNEEAAGEVTGNLSKQALKQKKKREAKKAAKLQQQQNNGGETTAASQPQTSPASNGGSGGGASRVLAFIDDITTDDPEKMKKIKKLRSKLQEIARLKDQKAQGKQLEINQVEKINKEDSLLKELRELNL
ncbi:eukaryotic translation initiation factor 2A [Nilaparvata lugens]|uniref:eukaryotic translation initiation factor 2A n=1 Tax=Nilaparvata lugens TaxID=108931 RepID=UPI00193D6278|nr:eukaryotic translation initiation factor 2A [Nilaparvata lugens]